MTVISARRHAKGRLSLAGYSYEYQATTRKLRAPAGCAADFIMYRPFSQAGPDYVL